MRETVGDEAVSAEVQATFLMMMNLCSSRNKIHKYGEKEGQKMLRIKLKCGLLCELTLRVNIHSKGQESPLSHHYVF